MKIERSTQIGCLKLQLEGSNDMDINYMYIIQTFLGYIFQTIPIVLLGYAPFKEEEFKYNKNKTFFVIICFLIGFSIICAFFLEMNYNPAAHMNDIDEIRLINTANILFTIMLVCMTIYYFLSLKRGIKGKIFGYIVGIQYSLVAYIIAQILSKEPFITYNIFELHYAPYGTNAVITYMLMSALIFPICYYLIQKLDIRTVRQNIQKNVHLLTIYSFMIFVLYIIILLIMSQVSATNDNRGVEILLIFLLVGLLLVAIFVYFMFYYALRMEKEKAHMQNQMLAFDLQYQAMNDKMLKEKHRIHDIHHHFRTLITLLENQQYTYVLNYLKNYLHEWEKVSVENICNNASLNSILSYYVTQAKQHNIEVQYEITVKDTYAFDLMDLTILLGNALENAIEACMNSKQEKPTMQLHICQKQQKLLIQIENSCDDSILEKDHNNLPYSSKQGRHTGYGISNMIQVTNKYQGNLEYWKNNNVFTLRILLAIP